MEDEARFAATPDRAPERAALPPRTGRRHRPGVRARPPSEASPLRDSAGITPASLGTAPPGRRGTQAAGSLSQPERPRGRWLTRRGTWDAWGADAGRGVSLRGRAGQWRNNELQASPGMSWRGLDSARGRIADEWPPVVAAPFPFFGGTSAHLLQSTCNALCNAFDSHADAGGAGTPELTPPVGHVAGTSLPRRTAPARPQPVAFAYERDSNSGRLPGARRGPVRPHAHRHGHPDDEQRGRRLRRRRAPRRVPGDRHAERRAG